MDASSLNAIGGKSHFFRGLNAHYDLVDGSSYHQKRDDEGTPTMIDRYLVEEDGIHARIRRDQEDNREERMRSYVDGWEKHWRTTGVTNTRSSKSSSP